MGLIDVAAEAVVRARSPPKTQTASPVTVTARQCEERAVADEKRPWTSGESAVVQGLV
jgi:hypothetical protein